MEKFKVKMKNLFSNPYFTGVIALLMAILLAVLSDYMFNAVSNRAIAAMVVIDIVGTLAICSAVLYIVRAKMPTAPMWKKIVSVAGAGFVFNFVWVLPYLIMNFAFAAEGKFAGRFAMILDGVIYAFVFCLLFYTIYGKKHKNMLIASVAIVLILVGTLGILWSGFEMSVSERMGVNLKEWNSSSRRSNGWALDGVPKYDGGTVSEVYHAGTILNYDYDEDLTGKETLMQVITDTDDDEFEAYCNKLIANGYVKDFENEIDDNEYVTFTKDGKVLHVYFTDESDEVRVIADPESAAPSAFSYTTTESAPIEVYQYALLYTDVFHGYGGAIEQCGMSYVIKLADNKLVIIDGGMSCQASDGAVDGFWDFCKEITGTQSGEKVQIAMWYSTHGHDDHIDFFNKLLVRFEGEYELERVMFNYPARWGSTQAIYTLRMRVKKYAPEALCMKCHTGQRITLGGAGFEVLYTHEDAYDAIDNKTKISNFNDSSTTLSIEFDGKKMLLLGDMDATAEGILLEMYDHDIFTSYDIVQVAHHGFNNLNRLYAEVRPEYFFFPQAEKNSIVSGSSAYGVYNTIKTSHPSATFLFARDKTFGLKVENGKLVVSERDFVGEDAYDGSPI